MKYKVFIWLIFFVIGLMLISQDTYSAIRRSEKKREIEYVEEEETTTDFTKKKPRRPKKRRKKEEQEVDFSTLPLHRGPKKRIAVMDFENKAGAEAKWNIGSGMSEMLVTSLMKSGRFIVIERQAVKDVLKEQDFGASGRTAKEGAARFGRILNAQMLVRGAVTEFENQSSGGGQTIGIKGFGLSLSQAKAHIAVNIRLYDTSTGQILSSERCEGHAESSGLGFAATGSDVSFGAAGFKKAPIGKATQQAIDKAVYFICQKMADVAWQGRIVTVKGDKVYVNAGSNSGVKTGDVFNVYSVGEELVDPETGLSLGSTLTRIGRVQVSQVQDKFSIAKSTAGGGFKRNDVLKLEEPKPAAPAIEESIF